MISILTLFIVFAVSRSVNKNVSTDTELMTGNSGVISWKQRRPYRDMLHNDDDDDDDGTGAVISAKPGTRAGRS